MIDRDEYVAKLKTQIDQWNTEAALWEAKAKDAQAGAQAEFQRQVAQFHARRDEALAEMRRLQGASADAFGEMMRGADAAAKSMQEAFDRARKSFEKK